MGASVHICAGAQAPPQPQEAGSSRVQQVNKDDWPETHCKKPVGAVAQASVPIFPLDKHGEGGRAIATSHAIFVRWREELIKIKK